MNDKLSKDENVSFSHENIDSFKGLSKLDTNRTNWQNFVQGCRKSAIYCLCPRSKKDARLEKLKAMSAERFENALDIRGLVRV